MRIAVTGAHGHVGVNLCKSLLSCGHEVNALSHKNIKGLQGMNVRLVKGDVLDIFSLKKLLNDVEVVIHLAAKISITGDRDGQVAKINTYGTQNLVNQALDCKVRRFIHFSSIHAFQQNPLNHPLDETRPLVISDGFAYDRSKAAGERAVLDAINKGLDAVILSPTAIIGPADPQPSLTGNAILEIFNNQIPALVPGGYDWVDVRDIVSGTISAIESGRTGEKYLLSGHWHSLMDLSQLIEVHSGRKTVKLVLPFWLARAGLPFITMYSKITGAKPLYTSESLTIIGEGNRQILNAKAIKELNYHPRPLTETIRDILVWFRENGYIK